MSIDWQHSRAEVTSTLQDLVRFDTTNPPGNEAACAQYIDEALQREGIPSRFLESEPGRGSVVGRLKGDGSERPLLLLSHIDVVPADPDLWDHPPFAAEIHGGFVWGRGTVDTKNLTAIEIQVMRLLRRSGRRLRRDVIIAATADEEAGGRKGLRWLKDKHPDLVDAAYVINEGGGFGRPVGDRLLFACQTAEKGSCWTKVTARGRSGHASVPHDDMAVLKLASALCRLSSAQTPHHVVDTVAAYVRALASLLPEPAATRVLGILNQETEQDGLAALPDPAMIEMLRASLRNTAAPTVLRAGEKINVIPSSAEAQIDCRILPGQTADAAVAELRAILGSDVEVEVVATAAGRESAYDDPFFECIKSTMADLEPNSVTAPYMMTGMTDARYFPDPSTRVYGFCPMKASASEPGMLQLAHGHNERISIDNLAFGTRAIWEIVTRFCS